MLIKNRLFDLRYNISNRRELELDFGFGTFQRVTDLFWMILPRIIYINEYSWFVIDVYGLVLRYDI